MKTGANDTTLGRRNEDVYQEETVPTVKRRRIDTTDNHDVVETRLAIDYLPDLEPYPVDISLEDIPKLCIFRPSPLICINQDIVSGGPSCPLEGQLG